MIDVEGANPQIPTHFITNDGEAIPIGNTLEILGVLVGPVGIPIETSASGNTVNVKVQLASAQASPNTINAGLASFDSASFSVDPSGFVTLSGSSTTEIDVDAHTAPGTDPVIPLAGVITFTGAQVAAGIVGTNVIRTNSVAPNTVTYEIQRATVVATTNLGANGVCHFNSADFTVDSQGFVTLLGGGEAIDSFQPDSGTNPVVPNAAGLVVMAGSGSTTTVGSLNTLTFQLTGLTNHAVLVGAGTTTITKVGPTATAGQILQSAGSLADPAFSTATYPATTTVSQILYSSSNNVVAGLATANNGVLITSTTGVPSILANGTTGQLLTATTGSPPSWVSPATSGTVTTVSVVSANGFAGTVANASSTPAITLSTTITGVLSGNGTAISGSTVTQHGVIVGGASNALTSTAVGSTGQVLQANTGADPTYSTATYPATTTAFQLLVSTAANVVGGLAVGTTGQVLTGVTGAVPAFSATPSVTSITLSSGTALSTYVQGTFTPTLVFGGSTTGFVYATQIGYYTRIGNLVHIQVDITLSTKGSGTGNVAMSGLPVTSASTATSGVSIMPITQLTPMTLTGSTSSGFSVDSAATTGSFIVWLQATGANAGMTTTNATWANNTTIRFQGFYFSS